MLGFLALPLSLLLMPLLGLAWLLWKRRYCGLAEGLGLALAVGACGVWAVFQSQSSTGALGLLPLPFYALAAGVLGWAGANARHSPRRWRAGLGCLALLAALAGPVLLLAQGFQTRAHNQQRAAQNAAHRAEIERNKAALQAMLAQHPGGEGAQIEALVQRHAQDRAWLLPLLEQPQVPPATLDRLADSADFGIVLSVARHPHTRPDTLARIYRRPANPDYFFSDLARHPNTPPELLRELYHRPRSITHLDRKFAANPALPAELRRELLAQTRDVYVIQGLLGLPDLDCTLLPALRQALARSDGPEDSYSLVRLGELQDGRCA